MKAEVRLHDSERDENRREFIKRAVAFAALSPLAAGFVSCQAQIKSTASAPREIVGGGCEGCDLIYESMPQQLSSQTAIASPSEPGERLQMSGIIYQRDGKTPAPGVILYVYHTDASGYYSPAPDTPARARRHGHLRGWMKSDARGEYGFTTVRPAPYPGRNIPAHIHPVIKEPDKNEYYIDEYVFDDDPLLTKEERARMENRGGSGIIRMVKTGGVWTAGRDIILGLNIPSYPG